jgi:hypothetical protein
MSTRNTVTIPTDIATILAERAREDLEHAAEKHADCVTKAHELRQRGNREESPEVAAVYYAEADHMDSRAERHDAEFKSLERICRALTAALIIQDEDKRDASFARSTPSSRRKDPLRAI